jgi:peptidoglycan/xylan/chitin deacetylase (PgdA/CDA1 family)
MLPVLEDLGFPATVFLPTGAIDGTTKLSWY